MTEDNPKLENRRRFLKGTCAALLAATGVTIAEAQEQIRSKDHSLLNEQDPGPRNSALEDQNPSSVWSPETDAGGQSPFKYPFAFSHKRMEPGGWTRQVTVRDLPHASMAGVQMKLIKGGVRELHWHVGAEWAYMISGKARITAVDQHGRGFVEDVGPGDLWLFPGGIPHSIQGVGEEGCFFLLVFDDGNFNEFETFLLTDWLHHTEKEVLAKNFEVSPDVFKNVPPKELFIFPRTLPRPLAEEKNQVEAVNGPLPNSFAFFTGNMKPTKVTRGGEVKIVDGKNFPATNIAAAIVTLKPGALRELHWHPNADEWQYYVKGKARMCIFAAGGRARTMDFQAGDVGIVGKSQPHFVENTGDEDLVFLEVFATPTYEDISLAEWLAHTPTRLVDQHLGTGEGFLHNIPLSETVIAPR
jgi:oxalate decarboxylase